MRFCIGGKAKWGGVLRRGCEEGPLKHLVGGTGERGEAPGVMRFGIGKGKVWGGGDATQVSLGFVQSGRAKGLRRTLLTCARNSMRCGRCHTLTWQPDVSAGGAAAGGSNGSAGG